VLCLWPDQSEFMALFMVFNLWTRGQRLIMALEGVADAHRQPPLNTRMPPV
jgi:hypothetical protein